MALQYLKEQPNGMVTDLGKFLELSKSSTTQLVERLARTGFIKKSHDSSDKRIVRLSITGSGEKEFVVLRDKKLEKMQKIFSKVPASDLRELIRIHVNLIEALKRE